MVGWGYHLGAAAWFLSINVLLTWGCVQVSKRLFRGVELFTILLGTVVLYSAVITVSMIVSAAFGMALGLWSLGIASFVAVLGLVVRYTNGKESAVLAPPEPTILVGLWGHRITVAILALAISFAALALFKAICFSCLEVDSLGYFLPLAAKWALDGQLPGIWANSMSASFPHHFTSIYAWLLLPFRAETMAIALQGLFQGLAVWCCYRIVVWLTGNRLAGACSSLLLVTGPGLFWFASTAKIDGLLMSWFIFGLYFTVLYSRTQWWVFLLFAGLSAGFCAGGKSSGLGYAVLLGAIFAFVSFGKGSWRKLIGRIAGWAGITLATGAFWYVRSWVYLGNPIYPARVRLFGIDLFPWCESNLGQSATVMGHLYLLFEEWLVIFEKAGLLPFILPMTFFLGLVLVWRGRFIVDCSIWTRFGFLVMAPLGAFLLYANCPWSAGWMDSLDLSAQFRYGFSYLASGAILVGLVGASNYWFQWILVIFSLVSAVIGSFYCSKIISVIAPMAAVAVIAIGGREPLCPPIASWKKRDKLLSKPCHNAIIVVSLILAWALLTGFSWWREQVRYSSPIYGYRKQSIMGEAWYCVDQNAKVGDLIAWDGGGGTHRDQEHRVFPLLGAPISRDILYIREQPSAKELQRIFLKKQPTLFVLSRSLSAPGFSNNLKWARSMPHLLEEVKTNNKVIIFRVKDVESSTSDK